MNFNEEQLFCVRVMERISGKKLYINFLASPEQDAPEANFDIRRYVMPHVFGRGPGVPLGWSPLFLSKRNKDNYVILARFNYDFWHRHVTPNSLLRVGMIESAIRHFMWYLNLPDPSRDARHRFDLDPTDFIILKNKKFVEYTEYCPIDDSVDSPPNEIMSSNPHKPSQYHSTTASPKYLPNDASQGAAEQTTTTVELSISCDDLPNCDAMTKSDPQVFVYLLDINGKDKRAELGRTECIADNLNPKFVKKILMKYHFEQIQKLRFEVYDIDPVGGNDFLGSLDTTLADIVASRSSTFKQPLVGGPRRRPGYLIVDAEELTVCKQVASFSLSASDLPPSFCGLLAPSASVHIYRSNESGAVTIVHRSQSIARSCNPKFRPFNEKLVTLCNGDLDRSIRFELVDTRLDSNKCLGHFETTINQLNANKQQAQTFSLMKRKKSKKPAKTSKSKATLTDFKLIDQPSFLDYIKSGVQIHFVVAIDFTASNGDPNQWDSLHHLDPARLTQNPYEQALMAVGSIIRPYDSQKLFAGFGFGAKLKGSNMPPSHLFALNGNDQYPYVSSVEDLLEVYRSKVTNIILSGPTNFAPCITHCNNIAKQFDDGKHYFVLLIVTDGIITDILQTKKAIIEASKSPLSMIICGVGDADFTAMDELDSDDVVMTVDGRSAQRDIVQFVPMNRFIQSKQQGNHRTIYMQQVLAEEVLRELPEQLTGYMSSRGFNPDSIRPNS